MDPAPPKRRPKVQNILFGLLAGYLLLLLAIYFRQDSLLYLPQTLSAEAATRLAADRDLRPWRTSTLHGYLRQPAAGKLRGTVVLFHGNAGHAIDREHYADALVPLGYRVVLAEYPAFGEKPGTTGEASLVADSVLTLEAARRAFPGPLYVFGESLGAGVAAAAHAARPGLVDGFALITPWDSLVAVASRHYPYLPVRWLLHDRYDSVANLRDYPGPVTVLVAEADQIVPATHGRRLFDSLSGRKALRVFAGADHNSWPADPAEKWWGEVMGEMERGK